MLYADYNATSPLSPEILDAMLPFLGEHFVNPSSAVGASGDFVRDAIDEARENVALLVDAEPEQVVFTSGGTESCFLALWGAHLARPDLPIVSSVVEHPAVYQAVLSLGQDLGARTDFLHVDSNGRLLEHELEEVLERPGIFSFMLANNETGIIFPVVSLARLAPAGSLFHTDGTQAVGKVPLSFRELEVDLMSLTGHKLGAPKGVGALILGDGADWVSPMPGGGQEGGARGGTLATAQIVGLGQAAKIASAKLGSANSEARDCFEEALAQKLEGFEINGVGNRRLPNTSSVTIDGVVAKDIVEELSDREVLIGNGSACSSSSQEPSRVLREMGLSEARCFSTIRVSFGLENCKEDALRVVNELLEVISRQRSCNDNKLEQLLSGGDLPDVKMEEGNV